MCYHIYITEPENEMKICEYCGKSCEDGDMNCPSCGANSFYNVCNNCGNKFKENFCPNCGVKAGQNAKRCPVCRAEYFSNACPNCGYLPGMRQTASGNYVHAVTPDNVQPRHRHTALWVLGWIFCFPIPLTILIVRSKSLPGWMKALLLVIIWVAVIALGSNSGDDSGRAPSPGEYYEATEIVPGARNDI